MVYNKIDNALNILNIKDKNFNIKKLKKHYHFLALRYHPDKNINNDDTQYINKKFQEINEAYIILYDFYEINNKTNDETNDETNDKNNDEIYNKYENINYNDLFDNFIKLLNIKKECEIDDIREFFKEKYNNYNDILLEKLSNNSYFNNLLNIFNSYDYKKKIIINTKLESVLNNEIYKFEINDEHILIPLWYKELYYKEYLIKIKIIDLPNNIIIDNNNNIFIKLYKNVNNLLNNDLEFKIINKKFIIKNDLLYLKNNCNYRLDNCGIFNPNHDISDINKNLDNLDKFKSYILINLNLC